MDWMDKLLYPLQWVVAWILAIFHEIFTAIGLQADSGWTWVLSIAGLTVVIRALLIPLFVYQIKSQRKMQLLQPEIQRLQAKYKGKKDQYSRQAMAEEQMALFRDKQDEPLGIVSAAARADADLLLPLPRHPQHAEGRLR